MIFGAPAERVLQKRQGLSILPSYPGHYLTNAYGGMESLNDLVLYRNGSVLMSENDELDQLRRDLFDLLS